MRFGFYRSVIMGFATVWLIPEEYFCKIMINIHQLESS